MKILLITDNHSTYGGAEKYFFELKTQLKELPHVEVFSLGFGPKREIGTDFIVLKSIKTKAVMLLWQLFTHPLMYFKLRKLIKKINPDIIHLHNNKQFTASVSRAIKHYPLVQTIHDYGAICPAAHNIHKDNLACETGFRWQCFFKHQVKHSFVIYLVQVIAFLKIRRWQKKHVRHFFAPSPLLVDYLKKNGFTTATYIPPFKKEFSYSHEAIPANQFLFAGNLGRHKGIDILIEEFALACQKNKNLVLNIAGDGSERMKLQGRIHALGMEKNIFLLGWVDHLDCYYQTCTAVIFPSLWMEAFGIVMMDAMSHARPVIGSNRGSPPWLIEDGQTGLIFNPLKPGDLAAKILILAENIPLAKKLGEASQKKLTHMIENKVTLEKVLAIYNAL